ncbi:MAG TPA: DUF6770 family protein [Flavobacterium sp.]|nr:DUF6770 family protein [Flavobacterium sp.]
MRKIVILFLLLPFFLSAQVRTLENLSRGQLYSYEEIYDFNNNIRGYILLFQTDKIAKETYELEYVVLDENLEKVTNGFLQEMKFESWLFTAGSINVEAQLYGNKLLLEFSDVLGGVGIFQRYRILDLKTNVMSDPFIFNKGEMKLNPKPSRRMRDAKETISEKTVIMDGVGLVVWSLSTNKKEGSTQQYIARFDDDMKETWRWVYDDEGVKNPRHNNPGFSQSDKDVVVFFNHFSNKSNAFINDYSIFILSTATGAVLNEYHLPDIEQYAYREIDTKLTADKIIVMGNFSKKTKGGFVDDTHNIGLFQFEFDKKTGQLLNSQRMLWTSLVDRIPINEWGRVEKEGYMYIHKMLPLSNGNIIAVAETFGNKPVVTNNMYYLLLDDKLQAKEVFEVPKFRNKFPGLDLHSSTIKAYGLFDFMTYQTMDDDEYLFYFSDNEKRSVNRKKNTLFGIVSYADGKFARQTLDLKTETSTIHAWNAKKGYLLLMEDFDEKGKKSELRLEKINY